MKQQIQSEVLKILSTRDWNTNAVITAATGVGKTKMAIDYIKHLVSNNPNIKILIIVPTEKLRDEDWLEEFRLWGAEDIWVKNVDRACYASLSKLKNDIYDMVILDELQHITINNSIFFENNTVKQILGLTATYPTEYIKKDILRSLKMKVVYDMPIDKAVELKLVAPYEIIIVETQLDNIVKTVEFGGAKNKYFMTEKAAYEYLSKDIERQKLLNPKRAEMLIFKRMRVLQNSLQKTNATMYIKENFINLDDRTLIFCGSIKQAEYLCAYTYHSKTNDKDLTLFREEKINQLSCVNALNEGVNIKNVDNAIITQVTSKERHLIQRVN
jgi:superfamily II DNA or RNA helicase